MWDCDPVMRVEIVVGNRRVLNMRRSSEIATSGRPQTGERATQLELTSGREARRERMVVIRLLGPVEVIDGVGNVHRVGSALRRTLLALMALRAGRWSPPIGCWSTSGPASHPNRDCERCDSTSLGFAGNWVLTACSRPARVATGWRYQPIRSARPVEGAVEEARRERSAPRGSDVHRGPGNVAR